jgi:hypothetical protein
MLRTLLLATAAGLVACAVSPPDQPASTLPFALTTDVSCNATHSVRCPATGCVHGEAGEPMDLPISIHVPRVGGAGSFCFATGCEDAVIEPTQTRGPVWTAIVRTNERTNKNAELTIARDLTFTLRDAGSLSIATWSGVCDPSGS